ncbi:MAG: hypothetical protein PHD95_07095 [Candidatus ainarchaeum sp.]|nr:hypothetical protein [Candidatus ainarchaeum sp.]
MSEFNYTTKTEFIRESLRDKLKALEGERAKKKAWAALFAARGSLKGKGKFESDGDFYKWRKEVFSKELENEFREKLAVKG